MACRARLALVVAFIVLQQWANRARALGLIDPYVVTQLMRVPTSRRSFWSKPEIAPILAPASDVAVGRRPEPASPEELAVAIESIVGKLRDPARELGDRAAVAARSLAASLSELDVEIDAATEAFQAGAGERPAEKLAALEASGKGQLVVREMLEQQLTVIRGLETRIDDVKARRLRRIELLRTLWLHTVQLGISTGASKSGETSERILRLCAEIRRESLPDTVAPRTTASDLPTLQT